MEATPAKASKEKRMAHTKGTASEMVRMMPTTPPSRGSGLNLRKMPMRSEKKICTWQMPASRFVQKSRKGVVPA